MSEHSRTQIKTLVRPSIFSDQVDLISYGEGASIAEIVAHAAEKMLPESDILVWMNDGRAIPVVKWESTYPTVNDVVYVKQIPASGGGGDGGKDTGMVVLQIAIMAAAIAVSAGALGPAGLGLLGESFAAGGMGAMIAGASVSIVGGLAMNMLSQPPSPNASLPTFSGGISGIQAGSNVYSIDGPRNRINKYGILSRGFGKFRSWPDYGALPYTFINGDDEYVRCLFVIGAGDYELSEHKLGETDFGDYEDVKFNIYRNLDVRDWYPPLYKGSVVQENLELELIYGDDYTTRTTKDGVTEIGFDIGFNQLFGVTSRGKDREVSVAFQAQYKKVGSATWKAAILGGTTPDSNTLTAHEGIGYGASNSRAGRMYLYGAWSNNVGEDENTIQMFNGQTVAITGFTDARLNVDDLQIQNVEFLSGTRGGVPFDFVIYGYSATLAATAVNYIDAPGDDCIITETSYGTTYTFTESTRSMFRKSFRIPVAEGQYQFRIKRTTESNTSLRQVYDTMYLTAIKSFQNFAPLNFDIPVTVVDMEIRASNQLNGAVDNYNCIAEALIPVYDDTLETWSTEKTRNPAWAYCEVMKGDSNNLAISDSRIYFDNIVDWANDADTNGWYFDHVFDYPTIVAEALDFIASTYRASRGMYDNKHTVVQDKVHTTPRALITPRNSRDFSASKNFKNAAPHTLRVRFPNAEAGYQQDEIVVYDDGYDADSATNIDTLDLLGVSSADQAWKEARYRLAAARLRPEVFSSVQDFEYLLLNRGDMFVFQHDVPLLGVGVSPRISSIDDTDGSGNVTQVSVDGSFDLDSTKTYQARVRLADNTFAIGTVEPGATTTYTQLTFTNSGGIGTSAAVDDLISLRESTIDESEMVCVGVQPVSELEARIFFQEHAPAVHSADTGAIPDYDPKITYPVRYERDVPPAPSLQQIYADETALAVYTGGILQPGIRANFIWNRAGWPGQVDFQFQYKLSDAGDSSWAQGGVVSHGTWSQFMGPCTEGEYYDVRVRAVSLVGLGSKWATREGIYIIGKSSLPPDVGQLMYEDGSLVWADISRPADFSHYRIAYNEGNNRNGNSATDIKGSPTTATTVDVSWASGTTTFFVWAVDSAGNESENPAILVRNIIGVEAANVIETDSEDPTFSGTKTNCTVDGGVLKADGADIWEGDDDNPTWTGTSTNEWWSSTYKKMTYEWTYSVPAAASPLRAEDRLIIDKTTTGADVKLYYATDSQAILWTGNDDNPIWTGDDDAAFWEGPTDYANWPGYLSPPEDDLEYFFKLEIGRGNTQGTVSELDVVFDAVDVNEFFNDVAIAALGTRLPLTKTFRSIKQVLLTLQDDGGDAESVRVHDKDETDGPLVKAYNDLQAATTGSVDAHIQGY